MQISAQRSLRSAIVLIGLCLSGMAQTTIKSAKDFFPGIADGRKVIYIEVADDEILSFDEADNSLYILDGRALEVRAAHAVVKGSVIIRSFAEGAHGSNTVGVAPKGDDGPPGADGQGDGGSGQPGVRGARGQTGAPGGPGRSARRMTLLIDKVDFSDSVSSLSFQNVGEKGGTGQTGGQGGTGGRGGAGHDRVCGGDGPGNAGPRGAQGAQGTGGQGGPGGNGGDVVLASSLFAQVNGSVRVKNTGGDGGEAGAPGALGLVGEPGRAGAGCGTDGGGDAKHIDPVPPEAYIPPIPSLKGKDGKVVCKDCVQP